MAAAASRLLNASIIMGHIFSGIGTWYFLREAYEAYRYSNTSCDDLPMKPIAALIHRATICGVQGKLDNDLIHLRQNISYWKARGIDIDQNRNFLHLQCADELARIEHIIRMRGESAKSMTIGEIAEELKDFGYIWQILATAEEGDVKMK